MVPSDPRVYIFAVVRVSVLVWTAVAIVANTVSRWVWGRTRPMESSSRTGPYLFFDSTDDSDWNAVACARIFHSRDIGRIRSSCPEGAGPNCRTTRHWKHAKLLLGITGRS